MVTLHPHPITVLRPDVAPSYLTGLEDRMELMRDAGAAWVLTLTFTSEVSEVTAEDLARAFFELLRMRLMVLGPDAAFGRGAPKDTAKRMRTLGAVSQAKRKRVARETREIYAPIANRLGLNNLYQELEELSFAHLYPMRHRVLAKATRSARGNLVGWRGPTHSFGNADWIRLGWSPLCA